METILRKCYDELGIKANATIYQNRKSVINNIVEKKLLDTDEINQISKWIIGISSHDIENILIKVEEMFCENDDNFSLHNKKEVNILLGIISYQYCIKNSDFQIPLEIICGYNVGYRLNCNTLFKKFNEFVEQERIDIRTERKEESIKPSKINKLKKEILAEKKEAETNQTEFKYSQTIFDMVIEILEIYENNISVLEAKNNRLNDLLDAQQEESNILWWLLGEWSETYSNLYKDISGENAALVAPMELCNIIRYKLYPYSVKQVLMRMISISGDIEKKITLAELVDYGDMKLFNCLSNIVEPLKVVQPILMALMCKREVLNAEDPTVWKETFFARSKNKADDIKMSLAEFSYQLLCELELLDNTIA